MSDNLEDSEEDDKPMKAKLSVTIEAGLMDFLNTLPGKTRSEKLERALTRFRRAWEEQRLRRELAAAREGRKDEAERDAWEATMAEAMWNE